MATFTAVSERDLTPFLRHFGLDSRGFGGIPAGSVNSNFWIETRERGRLFLRVYEEQGFEGARAEAGMLEAFAADGVPTPAPLATPAGERVLPLVGKPASLFPWREGGMRCQASVSTADMEQLGRALARMHRAGAAVPGRGPGRFNASDLEQRLDLIATAEDETFRVLAAPLRTALRDIEGARANDVPRGVVHGDLFRDNVLWNERGELSALLDFESAFEGRLVYDVAVCFLSWCYGDGFDVALARALVAGYGAERPLAKNERDALWNEARFGALRFTVTRITDYAMRKSDAPRVIKDYRRFQSRLAALDVWGHQAFTRDLFEGHR